MKKIPILVAGILAVVILVAGCGGSHSSVTPQQKASVKATASALASVPGADAKNVLEKAGVPINGTSAQQIAFFNSMKNKTNREKLAQTLKIPPQNKASFDAALLDGIKKDYRHPITKWLDQDLPNAYARWS